MHHDSDRRVQGLFDEYMTIVITAYCYILFQVLTAFCPMTLPMSVVIAPKLALEGETVVVTMLEVRKIAYGCEVAGDVNGRSG